MSDVIDPRHEALVEHLFQRMLVVLEMPGFELRPMRRRTRGEGRLRSIVYGYTRLDKKLVTIDLYTPRTMKTREMDAILRVVAHELAHHQKPPRLYRSWFRLVRKIHHPPFWTQYRRNVASYRRMKYLEYISKKKFQFKGL
ncbi:MAG: hypothetical protein WCT54_04435 [Patescibacteria group bacterium]